MKCDKCDNEATVHEVSIKGGKRHEKHLCEKCARDQGVNIVQSGAVVPSIMQTFIAVKTGGEAASASAATGGIAAPAGSCSACGQTFAQFRTSGVLGCPQCYATFEAQLTPLLSRAHEGGTHHVGKSPASAAGVVGGGASPGSVSVPAKSTAPAPASAAPTASAERVALLRKSLAEAIAGEQYEKAAKLRDELQRLQASSSAEPPSSRRRGTEGRA